MPFPLIPMIMALASSAMGGGSDTEEPSRSIRDDDEDDFLGNYLRLQEERKRRQQAELANMLSALRQPQVASSENTAYTSALKGLDYERFQ